MKRRKKDFQNKVHQLLDQKKADSYVITAFFIDRFQLITTFYGEQEGERILDGIETALMEIQNKNEDFVFGRIGIDVFCFAMEYEKNVVEELLAEIKFRLEGFDAEYDVNPNFGLYVIKDMSLPIDMMCNHASVAAKKSAGNHLRFFSYYTEEMDILLKREQEILNEMHGALERGEFHIYFQPKYNIHTNFIAGAEALVKWIHPHKGIISPTEFIPIFERNGFITKLDFYVWEQTCKQLKCWIDQGFAPKPISMNLSRANLYLSKLEQIITDLVDRYGIPYHFIELEITESTYATESEILSRVTENLRAKGFLVAMDDFGTGYSSLNILKDIEIDILKLDMQFMVQSKNSRRGQKILASMLRMAKWLKIPVVVEGVETHEQVNFLKSVGCELVQGFYYAKPMTVEAYEELCYKEYLDKKTKIVSDYDIDLLFGYNEELQRLFGNILQPLVIFEFDGVNMKMIKVNEAYLDHYGADDDAVSMDRPIEFVGEPYRKIVENAFYRSTLKSGTSSCEFIRYMMDGKEVWIELKLRYIKQMDHKHIILGIFDDITTQKKIDSVLEEAKRMVALANETLTIREGTK
ncbi:PAS domain S-box-containing protein [Clostridiales Family XIII bacterium PM5-7]